MSDSRKAGRRDVRRVLLPNLVLAASVALTLLASYIVDSVAKNRDQIRFDNAVRYVGDNIEDRIGIYMALLRSTSALYDASENVTRDEFRAFVDSMEIVDRYPGVRGIGFAVRLTPSSAAHVGDIVASYGVQPMEVWPQKDSGDDKYPIAFIEPGGALRPSPVGFDMYSEEVRRRAIDVARDTGNVTMTGRITPITESVQSVDTAAFLIIAPVYGKGMPHTTVEERRASMMGFVYAGFRSGDLFSKVFGHDNRPLANFQIYDGTDATEANLLYDAREGTGEPVYQTVYHTTKVLRMPGRDWTIVYTARADFARGSSRDMTYWTLFAGLGVSILLFLVSRSQVKARSESEAYAEELLSSRERLRLSEARLRRFVDSDLIGIEIIAGSGRLIEANDAFLELLGYAREDVADERLDWDTIKVPSHAAADRRTLERVTASGENATYETEYVRVDGTVVPVLEGLASFGAPDESVIGFTLDLSEQKRVEGERLALLEREREARQLAEEANRLKDEFLATVSHELRTPLNAILGWARLLAMGRLDEATSIGALETIERNAKTQAQLIEDLLDVSRIISGKLRLTVEPVDLVPVIAGALDALRPAAKAKAIHVETSLDPATGTVSGDVTRLQQVVWNLLSNAVKFTPRGGTVRVALSAADTYAKLEVSDTGPGIDQAFLPYVFERFRQADSSITRAHGGLGLGLAIVRHLTEMHGGAVSADSDGVGSGATFTIRLPLMGVRIEEAPGARTNSGDLSLAGVRVLVVDDDADSRDVLAMALGQYGAEVRTCANGEQALEDLLLWQPDVLISDIAMPGMNGHELIQRVRELDPDEGGATPAIALSAYSRGEDQKKSIASGYQFHMTKPFEPANVATVVAQLTTKDRRVAD